MGMSQAVLSCMGATSGYTAQGIAQSSFILLPEPRWPRHPTVATRPLQSAHAAVLPSRLESNHERTRIRYVVELGDRHNTVSMCSTCQSFHQPPLTGFRNPQQAP